MNGTAPWRLGERLDAAGVAAADRDDAQIGDRRRGAGVRLGDAASPQDPDVPDHVTGSGGAPVCAGRRAAGSGNAPPDCGVPIGTCGVALERRRDAQVLAHRRLRRVAVVVAQRLVDRAVHLGRLAQVADGADVGLALFVEHRRDHLDQRGQDRVVRGVGDGAVERDVVDEEGERLVERGEHPGHLLGDGREVLAGGALGGEAHGADLQHAARLEHLFLGEPVQRRHEAERPGRQRRRPVGDERAGAVARLHDAHRRQRLQPGPDRRTADADLDGELALGRQAIPGPELALLDERPDVRDDVLGRDAVGRTDDVLGG